MKNELGDLERIKHIKQCIDDLEEIVTGINEDSFYRDTKLKYATERILQIIGEAVNHLSPGTLAKSKKVIPWRDIVDFRNLVSHEYFRVDYTMVYKIATREIADLKPVIEDLIQQIEN